MLRIVLNYILQESILIDFEVMFKNPANGPARTANLSQFIPNAHDLIYFLYNLHDSSYPAPTSRQLRNNEVDKFKQFFDRNKQTLVIFHDYWINASYPIVRDIVLSVLEGKHNYNVVVVDYSEIWTKITKKGFLENVVNIGNFAADLFKAIQLDPVKTMMVGFSSGGLLAGACGRGLRGTLRAIIGLNTVGISKNDAKFVEYIHTTTGSSSAGLGHVDFYPHGGRNQTGCPDNEGCSQERAFLYFSESVNDQNFTAHKCDSWELFESGNCSSYPTTIMGTLDPDTTASGKYFLATWRKWPFSKG